MPHTETIINGIWYPSVSTILGVEEKPWLTAWKDKWGYLAERKTAMASKIGTEFHRCVEEYLDDGCFLVSCDIPYSMGRRIEGMMGSFIRWADNIDGVIHATELRVVSRKYAYSGTLDAVGRFGKKLIIVDWKTSSKIYPEAELQLAAYAEAYNERCESRADYVKNGLIVHVSKSKPDFKLTTKAFKLGKRPLARFLKLRANFDDASHLPITTEV